MLNCFLKKIQPFVNLQLRLQSFTVTFNLTDRSYSMKLITHAPSRSSFTCFIGYYEALKVITVILMISQVHSRCSYIVLTYSGCRFNASIFIPETFVKRWRQTAKCAVLHKPAPSAVTFPAAMYSCSFNCKWKTMRSIVIQLVPPNGTICAHKKKFKVSPLFGAQSKYSDPSYRNWICMKSSNTLNLFWIFNEI